MGRPLYHNPRQSATLISHLSFSLQHEPLLTNLEMFLVYHVIAIQDHFP